MDKNIVYVSRNINNPDLWTKELKLKDVFLRPLFDQSGEVINLPSHVDVRIRHRASLQTALLKNDHTTKTATLVFETEFKRPAAGQSAVFYVGDACVGGGIIE